MLKNKKMLICKILIAFKTLTDRSTTDYLKVIRKQSPEYPIFVLDSVVLSTLTYFFEDRGKHCSKI